MKILVTGGAGFIGSHLCARLLDEGSEVVCVDNLVTGSRANIEPLMSNDRFEFIEHDIIKPLLLNAEIGQIYNLASPASPKDFQELQLEIMHVNSYGLENILDFAREKNARIVHASTSEVYGDPEVHPQEESYYGNTNSYGPRSCYDEGKRFGEALIYSYKAKYGVDTGIVRIFNTYGPHMRPNDGRVVSNFINQAIRGEDLTVFGDGSQTRSFCYVDDMVAGLMSMMTSGEEGPINLGNVEEYTVLEVAEKVLKLADSDSKIAFKELPKDDPVRRKPDLSRAKELLTYSPVIYFEEGLEKTLHYFIDIKK